MNMYLSETDLNGVPPAAGACAVLILVQFASTNWV
jgi:hypothetical protein